MFRRSRQQRSILPAALLLACVLWAPLGRSHAQSGATAGNPVVPGWDADPEIAILEGHYWIYATYSADFDKQTYMEAFSSPDFVHWTKYPNIIDTSIIKWANRALWAPAISFKDNHYYLFFAANDIHHPTDVGGIGVAVSDHPGGPFRDYLGKPLLNDINNGAQPIDPYIFKDADGKRYLLYGGWGHCNIVQLNDDYTGFVPAKDGKLFHEITPDGYVEGPCMFIRQGKYYFMWSQGNWTNSTYNVAYAIGDSPLGPFKRMGNVLVPNPAMGTGAGGNTIMQLPGQDRWFIAYHRRPPGETNGNARVVCVDEMSFNADGTIRPVEMTNKGVGPLPVP